MKISLRRSHLLLALVAVPVAYVALRTTTRADGSGSGTGSPVVQSSQTTRYDKISADGLLETTTFDDLDHAIKTYTDGAGNVRRRVDAEGKVTVYTYDNVGNMLSWRDANGNGEDKVYDALSRCTSITDTAGSVHTFT